MSKMTIEETFEAFGEGVEYVTEERWVDPEEIEDQELSRLYEDVVAAYSNYKNTVSEFQHLLEEKYGNE